MIYLLIPYFLSISLYNPEIYGLNLSSYMLFIPILYLLIVYNLKIRIPRMSDKIMLLFISLAVVMCSSLLYSKSQNNGIFEIIKITFSFICYLLFINIIKKERDMEIFIEIFIISTFVLCIYSILQSILGLSEYYLNPGDSNLISRVTGTFKQPNVLASYITLLIPMCIYKIKSSDRIYKIIYTIVLMSYILTIYLTYSRWSIVSISIVFICVGIKKILNLASNINIRRLIIYKGGMLLILISILMLILTVPNNIKYIELDLSRGSDSIRLNSILKTLSLLEENPLGLGIGSIGSMYTLDSSYIRILGDLGLIGLLIYIGLCYQIYINLLKRCPKIYRNFNNIYYAVYISFNIFLIISILESTVYSIFFSFYMGLYMFISYINKNVYLNEQLKKGVLYNENTYNKE